MNFEIREAEIEDITGIQTVAERTYQDSYEGLMRQETIESVIENWYATVNLEEAIESGDVVYLVAVSQGEVIGYTSYQLDSEDGKADAELRNIYVDPDFQGEGVGTDLLNSVLDRFPDSVESIGLGVVAGNDKGKSFYRKNGFEKVEAVEEDIFGQKVECEVYVRQV